MRLQACGGIMRAFLTTGSLAGFLLQAVLVGPTPGLQAPISQPPIIPAAGGCKAARTCEEAVRMWCGGYSRADGDGDGIPCENVCHSLEQVEQIKAKIGC